MNIPEAKSCFICKCTEPEIHLDTLLENPFPFIPINIEEPRFEARPTLKKSVKPVTYKFIEHDGKWNCPLCNTEYEKESTKSVKCISRDVPKIWVCDQCCTYQYNSSDHVVFVTKFIPMRSIFVTSVMFNMRIRLFPVENVIHMLQNTCPVHSVFGRIILDQKLNH